MSTRYDGPVNPFTEHNCQLLARKFQTTWEKGVFQRTFFYDYPALIAQESSQVLLGIERGWILKAIQDFLQGNDLNTPDLREAILAESYKLYWSPAPRENWDKLLSLLKIYDLDDPELGEIYLVFAPITLEEAEAIQAFLAVYRELTGPRNAPYAPLLAVSISVRKNWEGWRIHDWSYLYPLEVSYLGPYIIFTTQEWDQRTMDHLFQYQQFPLFFPRIEDMIGCYATFLLIEATGGEMELQWKDRTLFCGECGYLQVLDLRDHFLEICYEIGRQKVAFRKIPNYATAQNLTETTNCKCLYYHYEYYAVIPNGTQISVEMVEGPDLPEEGLYFFPKSLMEGLGYHLAKVDPFYREIPLGYRTFYDPETDLRLTAYYYRTTALTEQVVHIILGENNTRVREKLQELVNNGYFFTKRSQRIMRAYPELVVGDTLIPRNLSREPAKLLEEMEKILSITEEKKQ